MIVVVLEARLFIHDRIGIERLLVLLHRSGHLIGRGASTTDIRGVALGAKGSVLRIVLRASAILPSGFNDPAHDHFGCKSVPARIGIVVFTHKQMSLRYSPSRVHSSP